MLEDAVMSVSAADPLRSFKKIFARRDNAALIGKGSRGGDERMNRGDSGGIGCSWSKYFFLFLLPAIQEMWSIINDAIFKSMGTGRVGEG